MKNLKKKIEVFCLVMMMCVMSIVPNMNVNAAATCTRTEPTEAQITAHDPIIYRSNVLGRVTASGVVENLGSISSYDDFDMPEGMAYVVPYGYKNDKGIVVWDYCGGPYAGTNTEVYVYNDATRKTSNATRISAYPSYQQKIDTLSNELKYKINTYGMFIRCIAVADDYTDWDDNPKTNYNGTVTCSADFRAYIEAYPDAYIDTKLSDTNTIIEGANGSLDGTATFPCANEYKHYEWQVAPADAYTDVAAANADKTDDKWTSCSGATYASAGGSVMTIMNTPKSLNNKYYRCKYDTGLKGAVASYSNVTQLKVTDAELTGVTAKSFGTNSSKYKPNVGDTVSTDDITVTTRWNNNNVIDKDGNDALVKGKLFFIDKNGKETSEYSFDIIGAGTVDVVYDSEGSVGKVPSVEDAYKSTLSFTVEDLTAPKAEPTADNTVKTDASKTTDITINASDNYDKAADIQYKLVKFQSDDKTYDMVQDFTKVGTGVYKLAAKNGNGKYGLVMKDSFGNISSPYTFTVEAWDDTAPTLDVTITPDVSKPSTYRTIKFNASDGDASNTNIVNNKFKYFAELETSNYKEKAYSAITDWSTTDGYTITKEGTYHLYCADKYGNMTTSKIDASKLNLDNEAPIIDSLSLTGENSSAFNVSTNAATKDEIHITAHDNKTATADILFKLQKQNGSKYEDVTTYQKLDKYTLTGTQGNGIYRVIAKDSFGNISDASTISVYAWDDMTPAISPAITPDVSKPSTYRTIKFNANDGDASNTNIVNNKFKYFAELETSNYKEKAYSAITDWSTTDGYTITKEGTYHLYCADKYGNMTTSKIDASKLNLDNEAPIIDSLSLTGENSSAFNVSTNAATKDEIHITAHDNKTATADILFKLQKQNGSKYEDVTTYQKLDKYTLTGTQGNGIYRVIAKDSFGNISDASTISVYAWDDMTPAISPAITPDVSKPSTYRTIKFNASDGDASNTNIVNNKFKYFMEAETTGYTTKQFSDIQDWSDTDGFTITKEGTYHLYCTDKYGNMIESQLNTLPLNLDNEPPTVSASVSNPDENDNVTVTLKAKDNVTAITKGCISINPNDVTLSDGAKDGDWTIYTFATKNMNDYTVKVSDDAGNSTDVVISAGQALSQTFTVKFLSEDGQVLKTENVVYGHSATPPTVEGKEGYTFNGWTGSFQNVTSNTTLYARFTKDSIKYVTVHYNTDGGNSIQDAQVESGSRAPYQKPIKSGYFFNGWYTDSNKGVLYDFGQGVTSETTIYASWSVDKANKLTNAELQDLLDKAKSSVTAQTKTVTVTKTEVKTVAAKDDPNVHKYTDAELQKLLEEARAAGYREGSASVKPEKIYVKAQAKAKDNTVTVSEDPRADVDDGNLVSVKFSLPEGRTFTKKLAPGTPIVVLDTDGQHIKDYKAENGLIIDLSNDSDDDLKGYNAYDLNDEYVLKQTCIEDEDTALADGNESLNTETVTEEDDNDKTSSVNMKTIGIISGISLAGIGLICLVILMLKRKKKRK